MGPDEKAPFGYMADPAAPGGKRPKKRPGRQAVKKTAAPEPPEPEQQEGPPAGGPDEVPAEDPAPERTPLERAPDRAPQTGKRRGRGARAKATAAPAVIAPKPPKEVIPFRAGPIAKGMNKLYRKIGKILRVANGPLGQAFIDITRKEDEDDVTVGEAWEELARVNPRIRGVLMKVVAGGAVGGLLMAHMPILIALLMLDPVARHFPLGRLLVALMADDEDQGEDDGEDQDDVDGFPSFPAGGLNGLLAGMSQADMAQAVAFAQQMGDQIGQRTAGGVRRGEDAAG